MQASAKLGEKELIEEIEGKLAIMVKKWTDDFVPQLEKEDPDDLLVEWNNNVHDISRQAENTIDELRKALKNFETKGAVASTVSTTLVDEESDEEEESSDGDDDEDAFGELDSDPDSDEDDSDVEGAGLEK